MKLTVESMRLTDQELKQLAAEMLPGPTPAGLRRVADGQLRKALMAVALWMSTEPDATLLFNDFAEIIAKTAALNRSASSCSRPTNSTDAAIVNADPAPGNTGGDWHGTAGGETFRLQVRRR